MSTKFKFERRDLLAAGGLAAFGAGFSQTLGRMLDGVIKPQPERHFVHGRSPQPEYSIDPKTGAFKMNPEQQISYTGCFGCTTQCGVRVRVDKKSGRVLRVTGNPYNPLSTDPHLPMNQSVRESLLSLSRYRDKGLAGRSTACGRGNAVMERMHSPYRVLTPLKRVGPRNSGRWEAISFEQLIREVVEGGDLFGEGPVKGLAALRDLKNPIDPAAPELGTGVNQVALMTSVNDGRAPLARRFWQKAYGTINYVQHGSYCGGAYRSGSGALLGHFKKMPHARPDISNAEFIIFVGNAPGNAGNPFKRIGTLTARARTDGELEYVVIDPVLNNSDNRAAADRAHWIPIRPGADGALAMAMMRWMFENDRVNLAYLAWPNLAAAQAHGEPSFTSASWLVITADGHPRKGKYLRGSDIGLEVAEKQRYKDADPHIVLDANGQPVAANTFAAAAQLTSPEAGLLINGKLLQVRTALELLRASVMRTTLDECAEICGIPVATITALADKFTSHGRKASIITHGGMMGGNGFYNTYSLVTLNALIGNLNYKGGYVANGGGFAEAKDGPRYQLNSFAGQLKPKGIPLGRNVPYERTSEYKRGKAAGKPYPARDQWFPHAPGLSTEWLPAAMRGYPYHLNALIMWMVNPLYAMPAMRNIVERDYFSDPKKLPLIISVDAMINESNAFADYIVPDVIMYETWGWVTPWGGVPVRSTMARWPVAEPRTDKTAAGEPINMEMFLIALAQAMDLPGFGEQAISDMEGAKYPLKRAEDWFLRAGANVAWQGKAPVGDASDEDMQITGVDRLRPALESTLKAEEWRKVALLYTRGGRYQPADQAQDAEHPDWQSNRFKNPQLIWNETLGGSRNSLSGEYYPGCAWWHPSSFADGTPMREIYPQSQWPMQIISFKSALHNSYSVGTRLSGLHGDNPVILHPDDATPAKLNTGDRVRIETPGGALTATVLVHEGVMPGVIAIEYGFGHRELGTRAHRVDDTMRPHNADMGSGICMNDIALADPTRGKQAMWVDTVSGTAVRNGLPARITRVRQA